MNLGGSARLAPVFVCGVVSRWCTCVLCVVFGPYRAMVRRYYFLVWGGAQEQQSGFLDGVGGEAGRRTLHHRGLRSTLDYYLEEREKCVKAAEKKPPHRHSPPHGEDLDELRQQDLHNRTSTTSSNVLQLRDLHSFLTPSGICRLSRECRPSSDQQAAPAVPLLALRHHTICTTSKAATPS